MTESSLARIWIERVYADDSNGVWQDTPAPALIEYINADEVRALESKCRELEHRWENIQPQHVYSIGDTGYYVNDAIFNHLHELEQRIRELEAKKEMWRDTARTATELSKSLESKCRELEAEADVALGFAYAYCCTWVEQGKDLLQMEVPLLHYAWKKANGQAAEGEGYD